VTEESTALLALALLLSLDFLTIAARGAFLQTSHSRLLALRGHMELHAIQTSRMLPGMPRLRATLDLNLVLVRFALAGLIIYLARQPMAPDLQPLSWLMVAGILALSSLFLFWFEWNIERWVARAPDGWAVRLTPFVRVLMFFFTPLLYLVRGARQSQYAPEVVSTVTEDELKTLVDAGQEEGVFAQDERRMIYSIMQLRDTLAREIMIPRIDILALEVNTPLPEAADAMLNSGHSRVPVFEDTVDNMLGLMYAKDLLRVWREGQIASLRDLLRPAYFVPEAKRVDELLSEMQSQRIHLAVVVDEYGGVAGLVTLEDIVEEVVGEIQDEYDQAEELPYHVISESEIMFQGRVDLDDFNEIMGSSLPKDEADTIGGYIYSRIGRVPDVGDVVQEDELVLTIENVTGRRIRKVRARWVVEGEGNGEVPNEPRG
jgi:putative hemolysin